MVIEIDARGLACPQPVLKTREAMQAAQPVVTLVDSDSARGNVQRMAEKAGWQVAVSREGEEYRIEMNPPDRQEVPQFEQVPVGRAEVLAGPPVLVVQTEAMGRGDKELGRLLMRSFFHTLGEVTPRPERIVLFNTGVKLACEGSPVLEDLCALEAEGIEIMACGTCLGYFELKEKLAVGRVSNMYEIAQTMLSAGKVVTL